MTAVKARAELRKARIAARSGDHAGAAAHCEAATRLVPSSAQHWLRLADALAELGVYGGADAAYARAAELSQGRPGTMAARARFMHRRGDLRGAAAFFAAAAWRDPLDFRSIWQTLRARRRGPAGHRVPLAALAFDVTDLLQYFAHHRHPSGIQRVQIAFARHLLASDPAVDFVMVQKDRGLLRLDPAAVARLLEAVAPSDGPPETRADTRPHEVAGAVEAVRAAARPAGAGPGTTVVFLGAFWTVEHVPDVFRALRAEGVRIGLLLYDLIPVTHPEFFDPGLAFRFTDVLLTALACADFALTISEATAATARHLLHRLGRDLPVSATPLGHALSVDDPRDAAAEAWLLSLGLGDGFVLCVCTIEPRKNHRLLLDLWRRWRRAGRPVPPLVLVGRFGWRVQDLRAQLAQSGGLGGLVTVLDALDDARLAALYRRCLFTVFPSFVEGWGLPVGESLAFGKVCATSNDPAVREVAGDLAVVFDPWSLPSAEAAIGRLIVDAAWREALEARIRTDFRPRSWSEAAGYFQREVHRLAAEVPPGTLEPTPPLLPPEADVALGLAPADIIGSAVLAGQATVAALGADWHGQESWGLWAADPQARLALRVTARDMAVSVTLGLRPSPSHPGHGVEIRDGRGRVLAQAADCPDTIDVTTQADPDGLVVLLLVTRSGRRARRLADDPRVRHVGLRSVRWQRAV